jgi:hypothetical protein
MLNCSLPKCYPVSLDDELVIENFFESMYTVRLSHYCTDWDVAGTGIGGSFMNKCNNCRLEGNKLKATCETNYITAGLPRTLYEPTDTSLSLDYCLNNTDGPKCVRAMSDGNLECELICPRPAAEPPQPPAEPPQPPAPTYSPTPAPTYSPTPAPTYSPTPAPTYAPPPTGPRPAQANLPPLVSPSSDSNLKNDSPIVKKQTKNLNDTIADGLDVNTLMYVGIAVFILIIIIVIKKNN